MKKVYEKNEKKQENEREKKSVIYLFFVTGLFLLVAAAFLIPQIVFSLQDGIRRKNIVSIEQENMDIAWLNMNYEGTPVQRLQKFAKGIAEKKEYFVDGTAYEGEESIDSVLEVLVNQLYYVNGGGNWMDYDFYVREFIKKSNVKEWKRYVVYDEQIEEGASFLMWYLHLELSDGEEIKVLMDTHSNTIYGVERVMLRKNEPNLYQDFCEFIRFPETIYELSLFYQYYYVPLREIENETFFDYSEQNQWETDADFIIGSYDVIQSNPKEQWSRARSTEFDKFMENYQSKGDQATFPLDFEGEQLLFGLKMAEEDEKFRLQIGIPELMQLFDEFSLSE